jgi:hypothetical protein
MKWHSKFVLSAKHGAAVDVEDFAVDVRSELFSMNKTDFK